jgi:hypothetical protein
MIRFGQFLAIGKGRGVTITHHFSVTKQFLETCIGIMKSGLERCGKNMELHPPEVLDDKVFC